MYTQCKYLIESFVEKFWIVIGALSSIILVTSNNRRHAQVNLILYLIHIYLRYIITNKRYCTTNSVN